MVGLISGLPTLPIDSIATTHSTGIARCGGAAPFNPRRSWHGCQSLQGNMYLEADLRWLEMTEGRLDEIKRASRRLNQMATAQTARTQLSLQTVNRSLKQESEMELIQADNLTKVWQGDTKVVALDHGNMSVAQANLSP
jgi:hypothetical protein